MGLIRLEPRLECEGDQRCRTAALPSQRCPSLVSLLTPLPCTYLAALSEHERVALAGGSVYVFFLGMGMKKEPF